MKIEPVIDGPLTDDTLTYTYDALGRVSTRGLGATGTAGTTNTMSYAFNDALGRLKMIGDPLGTFMRTYQGVTGRVDNVQRTGGMKTVFAWEPSGDRRMTGIQYEDATANVVAQFGYGYALPDAANDPTAQIRQWRQWHRGLGGTFATQAKKWDFRYDAVDQLAEAVKVPVAGGAVETSLGYGYDPAGNRTQVLANGTASQFLVNPKNQFTATGTAQSAPVRFAGTVSANSVVTLAGQPATGTAGSLTWETTLSVATGTNSLTLLATETNPPPGKPAETTRRKVNLTLATVPAWSFGYDDNGSMLSALRAPSSALAFEWDAANRLSAIVKDGKRSELSYDGQSRWTGLVEKTGTATTAPVLGRRRFVWEGYTLAQIREYDASDALTGVRNIFPEGEVRTTTLAQDLSTGTKLLYLRDHLGSVREMVNASDLAIRAGYDYDPYGQRTKLAGDLDCDFGFTGHYEHWSGITLAPFRGYLSPLGRWLSRDPIGEEGGMNLYGYVANRPTRLADPLGLAAGDWWDPRSYASVLSEMNPFNLNGSFSQTSLSIGDAMGGALNGLAGNGWNDLTNAGNGANGNKGLLEQTECDKVANTTVKLLLGTSGVAAGGSLVSGAFASGANSLFWTTGIRAEASALAEQTGLQTLEQTIGGRALTFMGRFLPDSVMNPLWIGASANYAANASGTIRVLFGDVASRAGVWATIEYRILQWRGLY